MVKLGRSAFPLALVAIAAGLYAQTKAEDFQAIQALTRNTSKDVSIEVKPTEKKTVETEVGVVLYMDSYPPGSTVYLNGFHAGVTPLTLRNQSPGGYRVSVKKERYKPLSFYLDLDPGTTVRVKANLKEITGTLKLISDPEDTEAQADLFRLDGKEAELPVGSYELKVRKFGWETYSTRVDILEDKITTVNAKLLPAEFRIEDFSISRSVFNPENPGLLGITDFRFLVTAPGNGVLRIYDLLGNEVYTTSFPPFSTWNQSKDWNGRGNKFAFLPDGTYRVVVEAVSSQGKRASLEGGVSIDRKLRISYRNFYSGQAGLLFAPTVSGLPQGSYQVGTNLLALSSTPGGDSFENLDFFEAGASIGILSSLELTPVVGLRIMNQAEPPDVVASVGLKYLVHRGSGLARLSFAATTKGTLASDPSYAGFSQFPGLGFGGIAQLDVGPLSFVAAPEIQFSPYPIGDSIDSWKDRDFHAWGIGRFAIFFDSGHLITGFSTAVASRSFRRKEGILYPIHTGFEAHWLMPNTLLYLSGFATWEYYPNDPDRIFLGGGVGIIY